MMDSVGRSANVRHTLSDTVSRRAFLRSAAAATVVGPALTLLSCAPGQRAEPSRRPVRFGLVTDCHYADAKPAGTRFYRDSLDKLSECVARMNVECVDFLIELGDFKDQDTPPVESRTLEHLRKVEDVFCGFAGRRYHVLGNHDMDSLSKRQFLRNVENTGIDSRWSYYSFDVPGLHCVVLDANYRSDGVDYDHGHFDWTDANIPAAELAWLQADLAASEGGAVVFLHQLLDGRGPVYVKNAAEVRRILQESGKVLAVFQGHHHEGSYSRIEGIHYYTLKGMIEGQGAANNSYAIVELKQGRDLMVAGCRNAVSKNMICGDL
jgi:predicted phosphodiesterase